MCPQTSLRWWINVDTTTKAPGIWYSYACLAIRFTSTESISIPGTWYTTYSCFLDCYPLPIVSSGILLFIYRSACFVSADRELSLYSAISGHLFFVVTPLWQQRTCLCLDALCAQQRSRYQIPEVPKRPSSAQTSDASNGGVSSTWYTVGASAYYAFWSFSRGTSMPHHTICMYVCEKNQKCDSGKITKYIAKL